MDHKELMTLKIFDVSDGTCCLTGKETQVLVVTTEDGFLVESPLSPKGLMTLANMRKSQRKKVQVPEAEAVNGTV